MRIAVFTDIHGNLQALESILKSIKEKNIDKIICLGDTIGLGPSSNECLRLINSMDIIQIAGNHELYYTTGNDKEHVEDADALEHNDWIHKHMSEKVNDKLLEYVVNYNGFKLYFTHYFTKSGYPFESSSIFKTDDYKEVLDRFDYNYVFFGHRHEEEVYEYNNNFYYSLASSGCTKNNITCYYIIDISDKVNIEKVELKYDRDLFIKTLREAKYPNKDHIADYFFGIKNAN